MTNASSEDIDELKGLASFQLASLIWPTRRPQDKSSYLEQFTKHIIVKFNEPTPHKYAAELQMFSSLRNKALSCLAEKSNRDHHSLRDMKRYYCQLAAMQARFRDSDAIFVWKDSFGPGVNEGNIEFEVNNVMYCIGAIHDELGAKIPKTSESSAKEAISHFSSALWWLTELRDHRSGLKPKEMGHDLLTFYTHVLRAQAQENVLGHSIRSGMNPELVSKISAQIASDYEIASKLAQTPLYTDPLKDIMMGTAVFNNWKATVSFKHKYFSSLTYLLVGISYKDDNVKEIGSRVGYLKYATHQLDSCKKLLSDTLDQQSTKAAFEMLNNLLTKKLEKAIRYNDNVYHAKIITEDQLQHVEGKLLITPAPFSHSSIADFKDLFSSLVTIESVEVNSLYSQKKDDLSRNIRGQVEKQDEELAHMMSTLNIDKKNLKVPTLEAPEELMEICAELSMSPHIIDEVLTKLEELDDKREEMQKLLDSCSTMLTKNQNPSYDDQLKQYQSMHNQSLKTIQSLHKQLNPEMKREIQKMASTANPLELLPNVSEDTNGSEEIIKKLEKLLDKVEEMKNQRVELLNGLKSSLEHDDVIKHVVAASSEHEVKSVFDSEIQKHDKYVNQLQDNLKLQGELLDTIEKVNAEYGQVKLDMRLKRTSYMNRVESLKKYYIQFKTVNDGIDKGLEYYNKMLDIVRKFCNSLSAQYELHDLLN